MSTPITITATVPVHLFTHCWSIDDLSEHVKKNDIDLVVSMLCFGMRSNTEDDPGRYTEIGDAQITITLHSHDELVGKQIASLQAMLQAERASSVQRQNAILAQISKLSAISYDASEAA